MKNKIKTGYKVNKKLYDYAIAEMPKDANKLEKAWHIYERLCKTLNYSLDYFIDENSRSYELTPIAKKFLSLDYVETVDGEKNKEVVCYVFTAIYAYILYDQGLITEEDFLQNQNIVFDHFKNEHSYLNCVVDGVPLRIDSAGGIDMDLCRTKYGSGKLEGWKLNFDVNCDMGIARQKLQKLLEKQEMKLFQTQKKADFYTDLKKSQNDFKRLSFNERISLFFDSIKQTPAYSFSSLSYVNVAYRRIFSLEESRGIPQFVDSTFIYEEDEVKEYLFVNKKGYEAYAGKENFDSLEIYVISLKNKGISKISREKLLYKIDSKESSVFSNNSGKSKGSFMMNTGCTIAPEHSGNGGQNGKN